MRFVLLNEASAAPLTSQVTRPWLQQLADAATIYLDRDVSYWWGGSHSVRAGADASDIAPGEIVFAIKDALPEAPGAGAYHDRDGQGVPVLYLALSTCAALDDVSIDASHELAETVGDPGANLWADDGAGREWANELADAVQAWSYSLGGVAVSDFLLPSFFVPGSPGPYHYLATQGQPDLSGPFVTAQGGYQIVRSIGGTSTQVLGTMIARRQARRGHWSSRVYRRGWRSM